MLKMGVKTLFLKIYFRLRLICLFANSFHFVLLCFTGYQADLLLKEVEIPLLLLLLPRGTALHAVVVERCLAIMEPGIMELLPNCFQIIPEPFGLGFLGLDMIP